MEERKPHFERPTSHQQKFPAARRSLYLIGVIIISMLAGALGFVGVNLYLYGEATPPLSTPATTIIRPVEPLSSQQDIAFIDELDQHIASIYTGRFTVEDVYDSLPDPSRFVSEGVIMTSDGWLAVQGPDISPSGTYSVYIGGEFLPVSQIEFDSFTNTAFLKVDNVFDWSPTDIARTGSLPGQQVLSLRSSDAPGDRLGIAYIGRSPYVDAQGRSDYISSSSVFSSYSELISVVGAAQSDIYFDLQGYFIGFMSPKGLIPGNFIADAFTRVLGSVEYTGLGVYYFYPTDSASGVVVYHPTLVPVLRNSVADQFGVRGGDIILQINSSTISRTNTLDAVWASEQEVSEIIVLRDGERISLTVEN